MANNSLETTESMRKRIIDNFRMGKHSYIRFHNNDLATNGLVSLMEVVLEDQYFLARQDKSVQLINISDIWDKTNEFKMAFILPINFIVLFSNISKSDNILERMLRAGIDVTYEFENWYNEHKKVKDEVLTN